MDDHTAKKMEQKRADLQLRLYIEEKINKQFIPWLEIYDCILKHQIKHSIIFLACINEDEQAYWDNAFQWLKQYAFSTAQLLTATTNPVHENLVKYFPSNNPLRYAPDIPVIFDYEEDMTKAMNHCVSFLPERTKVLFFYDRYSPVLRLSIVDLRRHADELIQPLEQVYILTPDYRYLVFKSLEDEWRIGINKGYQT